MQKTYIHNLFYVFLTFTFFQIYLPNHFCVGEFVMVSWPHKWHKGQIRLAVAADSWQICSQHLVHFWHIRAWQTRTESRVLWKHWSDVLDCLGCWVHIIGIIGKLFMTNNSHTPVGIHQLFVFSVVTFTTSAQSKADNDLPLVGNLIF